MTAQAAPAKQGPSTADGAKAAPPKTDWVSIWRNTEYRKLTGWMIFFLIVCLALTGLSILLVHETTEGRSISWLQGSYVLGTVLSSSFLAACCFIVSGALLIKRYTLVGELRAQQEDDADKKRLDGVLRPQSRGGDEGYFDGLIKLNLENLGTYYRLARKQTNRSFGVAIAAGIAGFIFVLVGILAQMPWMGGQPTMKDLAWPGVVTEFISAVFFYLYNRAANQMQEYHQSLIGAQNTLLAITLMQTLEGTEKAKAIVQLIGLLAGQQKPLPAAVRTASANA